MRKLSMLIVLGLLLTCLGSVSVAQPPPSWYTLANIQRLAADGYYTSCANYLRITPAGSVNVARGVAINAASAHRTADPQYLYCTNYSNGETHYAYAEGRKGEADALWYINGANGTAKQAYVDAYVHWNAGEWEQAFWEFAAVNADTGSASLKLCDGKCWEAKTEYYLAETDYNMTP